MKFLECYQLKIVIYWWIFGEGEGGAGAFSSYRGMKKLSASAGSLHHPPSRGNPSSCNLVYSWECQSSKPITCRKKKAIQGLCG